MQMEKKVRFYLLAVLLVAVCFALNLLVGSVRIPVSAVFSILFGDSSALASAHPSWHFIVVESRLPQAITAMLCGAALGVSGLLLQTAFRNPLAGPSIFGIANGAGLGVAIVMLALGGSISTALFSVSGFVAVLLAAFVGAMLVTGVIFFFSTIIIPPFSQLLVKLYLVRVYHHNILQSIRSGARNSENRLELGTAKTVCCPEQRKCETAAGLAFCHSGRRFLSFSIISFSFIS